MKIKPVRKWFIFDEFGELAIRFWYDSRDDAHKWLKIHMENIGQFKIRRCDVVPVTSSRK